MPARATIVHFETKAHDALTETFTRREVVVNGVSGVDADPLMPGRCYCMGCKQPVGVFDRRLPVPHNGPDGTECMTGMRWNEY